MYARSMIGTSLGRSKEKFCHPKVKSFCARPAACSRLMWGVSICLAHFEPCPVATLKLLHSTFGARRRRDGVFAVANRLRVGRAAGGPGGQLTRKSP